MNTCKHRQEFINDNEIHCMAYSEMVRKDGKWWAHFPVCSDSACPFLHPELVKDEVVSTNIVNLHG